MSSIPISHPDIIEEEDGFWRQVEVCERLASAILLLLLSPLLLGIAIATLALSGRTPLIAHRRVGRYGSELWVLKFRTMWERRGSRQPIRTILAVEYIDDETGPSLKGPHDLRVASRFARFCRKHSLDELPQIVQVAMGRMSLVGPRPVTQAEVASIYGPDAREILRVKPGLAGLWQVNGRNRLTAAQRRALDLQCARDRSLGRYLWILMRAIPEVLVGGNTW